MEDNLFRRSSKAHGIARQGLAQGSTSAIVNLVSCPRNNIYFAGSQLAVFQGANERPYLNHTGRESNAEKRPTGSGPTGCDENGPATALLVGHVSIQICSAPRALSTAHFDRNKIHAISGTGH